MITYESLMYVKNPCDFAVVWKSEYPEQVNSAFSRIFGMKIQKTLHYSLQAPAVPKDFPYKKIFNAKLLRLIETGVLDSIGENYWLNNEPECDTVTEDVDSLALGSGKTSYILTTNG